MKKVLCIETSSEVNGGQKMSLIVSEMLVRSSLYEVVWVIPEEGALSGELKARGFCYYLLGNLDLPSGVKGPSAIFKYGLMTLKAVYRLNKIVKKENIDILYAPGPASLPWAAICGTMKHTPVIWHLHHIFKDGPTKKLLNICSRFNSVKIIITVSQVVGAQITDKKSYRKVNVLYNPVDYEKYKGGDAANIIHEPPFSFTGDKKRLIIEQIGIIHPSKEQDKVIRFCACLYERGRNVYAVFIGKSGEDTDKYRKELDRLAQKFGISDRIFYTGQRSDVNDLIKGAGVVVVPSMEGFSLVALEAMAAGVPVVATERGGVGELIRISGAGYTYSEDENLSSICDKIEASIGDVRIIAAGEKFAKQHNYTAYSTELYHLFG